MNMTSYTQRLKGALKLKKEVFEEVEANPELAGQALLTVALASLCFGIGGGITNPFYLVLQIVSASLGWLLWVYITHWIGTHWWAESDTRCSFKELMRTTGFAFAPGLFQVFALLPLMEFPVRVGVGIWTLFAFVIAVRQALDYKSTARAFGVCAVGWIAMQTITLIVSGLLGGPGV